LMWDVESVEVLEFRWPGWAARYRRIGVHRRKARSPRAGERTYESPRVVLPPRFLDLVGKLYIPVRARVRLRGDDWRGEPREEELEAVVLLVRG